MQLAAKFETPAFRFTDAKYNTLIRIARYTGMDSWFQIRFDNNQDYSTAYILDKKNNVYMDLQAGVMELIDQLSTEDYQQLDMNDAIVFDDICREIGYDDQLYTLKENEELDR